MQFLPADFNAFASETLGIAKQKVTNEIRSLLFGNAKPRNSISASSLDNEAASQKKTSFQNLLTQQQADKQIDKAIENPAQGTLTRGDLMALRDILTEQGVSADRLNRLNALAESGRAVSPEEVTKALLGVEMEDFDMSVSFDLTDTEIVDLKTFLNKLGFGHGEVEGFLNELSQGGDVNVWNQLEARMTSLSSDDLFKVSKQEISALARAFRLSDSQRTQLESVFSEGAEVNGGRLADALSLLKTEMGLRNQSDMQLAGSDILSKGIADVLALSKNRKEVEDKSDNRQSKAAQRMDVRIKDKVNSQGDVLPQAAPNPENKEGLSANVARAHNNTPDNAEEELPEHSQNDKPEQQRLGDNQPRAGEAAKTRTSTEGDSFINRVINADPSILGASRPQNTEAARSQTSNFTSQLFNQVETGLLKSINNGVKELTLQLDPGDLGTLTLVVSVREKEVSAIIRPDSAETAKLVEEQLYKIRQSLESQGLKVDNLEVQTNVAERDANSDWQGTDKHNFTREELEYRERSRLLHRLRQADVAVAQDMQNTGVVETNAAKNSQSEIYIVA